MLLSKESAASRTLFAFSASTPSQNKIHFKNKKASVSAGLLYPLRPLPHSSAIAALGIPHPSGHVVLHPPQTPSQSLGQLVPRAPQPRLQGVFRDPQLLGSFARRISLYFAQHERCPQQRREFV